MYKLKKENKSLAIIYSVYIVVALYLYVYLAQGHYRWNSTDNAWGLAWIYNYVNNGIISNPVFGRGLNSPDVFGILRCNLYGGFLNIFGWTRANSFLLSTIIFGFSVFIWYRILKKMKFGNNVIFPFIAIMIIIEPFFSMAHLARPDSLAFFFVSLGLLFFINGNFILSGFLGMMSFETHPMGLIMFFYALAYFLANRDKFTERKYLVKSLILFIIGVIVGLVYYYLLHGFPLELLVQKVAEGKNMGKEGVDSVKNFLYEFYFKTDYKRHVPELLIFTFFVVMYLKNKLYKKNSFAILLPFLIFISSLIVRLANHSYGFYFYPGFILLIVYTASELKWERYTLILFLCLLIPQYTFVGVQHKNMDFDGYIKFLQETVTDKEITIYGQQDDWFAFYDRDFYSFKNRNINYSEDIFYYINDRSLESVQEIFPGTSVEYLNRIEGVGSDTSVYLIKR